MSLPKKSLSSHTQNAEIAMNFIETYNLTGIVIGAGTFLVIGLFHPLVVRGEYHFGVRCWWAFLVTGLAALVGSLAARGIIASSLLGVTGFTSLWAIGEVFQQRRRVEKGWFPANPKRKPAKK
jgi:lysylphosphatidylglycerol synthetase-like protein (DUF2156 family)